MLQPHTLHCPTCGATQPWQPECRRCKSDLRLLVDALVERQRLHRECLEHLSSGRYAEAVAVAGRLDQRFASDASRRLLAVSLLANGQHRQAAQLASLP